MEALKGILGYTFILIILELCQQKTRSYEIRCPKQTEWSFKARAKCGNVLEYFCVHDDNVNIYTEFCKRNPDITRDITWKKGQKCVFRGNLDGEVCAGERYQPFKFRTDGNSDCAYKKSFCREEGMINYNNGTTTLDTQCRCDHTKGFAFISMTKQSCVCIPSQEDCSCYKKTCKGNTKLSSDYNCVFIGSREDKSACSSFGQRPSESIDSKTPALKQSKTDILMVVKRHSLFNVIITAAVLAFIVIISMLFWKGWTCIGGLYQVYKLVHVKNGDIDSKMEGIEKESHDKNEIYLFEMKLRANYKMIVTTIYSKDMVNELQLTASERKSIDSCLGRIKGNKTLLETVQNRGSAFHKEFMKVLNQKYPDLAARIENTKEGEYYEDATDELQNLYNEKIPENVRSFHDNQIRDWILKDNMIIETEATRKVLQCLQVKNCVLLVGRPGSGKSSIIRHIALMQYENEDIDIIPVVIEPSNVLQYYNHSRNQIFVLDDFCGKSTVNNQLIELWKLQIENVLGIINRSYCFGYNNTKARKTRSSIVISCTTNVYNSKLFGPLEKLLEPFVLKLSDIGLTPKEREEMITKYAPKAKVKDFMNDKDIKFDFPLLCKLSKGKDMAGIKDLFTHPHDTIIKDLTNVQNKEGLQFCALALCTLLNNNFKAKWLKIDCESGDGHAKNAVREMCLEFNLDLAIDTDRKSIQEQFSKEMDWLSKSDDTYHHIHGEVFNIALVLCGRSYQRCFIKHAPSSVIAKRFSLLEDHNGLITIKPKNEKLYFDRLIRDLENGITYSTFENVQMENKIYRTKFIKYCRKRETKLKDILSINNIPVKDTLNKEKLYRQKTFFYLKPPLIDCSMQGYADMVELLLEMNCDVNTIDDSNKSALCVASQKGHLAIVQMLIEKGADISLCDNTQRTSLHVACENGYENIVQCLIDQEIDISARDENGCTALHLACASGNTNIVKRLINKKRDEVDTSDNYGQTPIIIASLHGQIHVVNYLLTFAPRQVSSKDKEGFTPLLAACMNGCEKTVIVLIQKNSDIHHVDKDGRSALFIACAKGHTKIAADLLKEGKEAIINVCDWHAKSPLYIACEEKRTDIVKLLIENGAQINKRDEANKSPIYIACEKGNEDIVKFLLDNDAEIDTADINKNVPLHVACKAGDLNIVDLLQGHKDCSTLKNKWKETGLDIARKNGHKNIINFLDGTCIKENVKKTT